MGAVVGTKRRYIRGMQPSEYWDEIAWPDNRETLEVLRFTHDQALLIFKAFVDMDRDNSGEMSVEEFHQYLGVPQTKFSERVFGIIDLDGSGELDFLEFAVGVWNYCTYDTRLITKLAFDIFDIDRKGVLDLCECDALLRMVYDVDDIAIIEGPPSGKELLAEMDVNGDGDVTIDEFSDLMDSHMYILAPAFDLQRALRQRLLGVKHWEGETRVRQVIFAEYDSLSNNSWESIREILQKKKRENEADSAAEEERKDTEARDQLKRQKDHQSLIRREQEMRQKRKLEAAAADQTPEDHALQAAKTALEQACVEMNRPFTYAELQDKTSFRKRLYECFDTFEAALENATEARKIFALHRATVDDAETMVKETLKSKEGRAKEKFHMQLYYGKEMYEAWTDGSALQNAIAPMFKAPDEDAVTMATAIKMKLAKQSDLTASREHAHTVLVEEFREKLKKETEESNVVKADESKKACERKKEHLVAVYGSKNTNWEKLVDENSRQPFWYHTKSGSTLYDEPAICHNCDQIIDGDDVRCFSCQTERSHYNRELYTGSSILPKLENESELSLSDTDEDDDE